MPTTAQSGDNSMESAGRFRDNTVMRDSNSPFQNRNKFFLPGPIWLHYLLALPIVIGALFLAAFFFAAFLALFTVVAIGFALRIWWLRRKLRKRGTQANAMDGEYVVIREHKKKITKD